MFKPIPAFHRMKHPNRITIKDIIKNFKRVGIPVKADKQPFIFGVLIVFDETVILNGINSPPDVGLAYAMLESRLGKLDVNVHA
jgi:hypothetical protein